MDIPGDRIYIRDLVVRQIIGQERWERERKQNVVVNATLYYDCTRCGQTDDLRDTVNYGSASKAAMAYAESTQFKSVEALATGIAQTLLRMCDVDAATVRVEKPTALLFADSAGVEITRTRADFGDEVADAAAPLQAREGRRLRLLEDKVLINNLLVRCVVGCNPWEREEAQSIIVNLVLWSDISEDARRDAPRMSDNYMTVARAVVAFAEPSRFRTVEALAAGIARVCLVDCGVRKVTVRVDKPAALLFAKAAGLEIVRDRSHIPLLQAAGGQPAPVHDG